MLTPAQFVSKWQRSDLAERAASQEHFLDLCRLLGQPTPAEHDATGAEYAFEKGVDVAGSASKGSKGDRGYADVWWKGKFGWEYKRKDKYKTLEDAYRQLLQYREALESPPLLIVSDIARIEIHTNFTGTRKEVHTIALADLADPKSLSLLRRVFTAPESFRPLLTAEKITQAVAADLGKAAEGLRNRGHDPHDTAHFLMKCMFCLFAEDVGLLPDKLFSKLLEKLHYRPTDLTPRLTALFAAMRTGGAYGNDDIAYFNGGLFDETPALELKEDEIGLLKLAAAQDWGSVDPSIFGTLFERSLDPAKRSQIGAHYTHRDDILLVVEPVIMEPLQREWAATQAEVSTLLERRRAATTAPTKKRADAAITKALQTFLGRLSDITILDPACGSGNFLYVAIQRLLDLEKEVITFAARPEISLGLFPNVRPTQLRGIEINPYAAELAQVVIWIGYLQWMRDNGFQAPRNPVLANLSTIENRDAILKTGKNDGPLAKAAEWPPADFIVGNPPFLGGNYIRRGLGDAYVEALFGAFRIPHFSDLCCYWFELARKAVEASPNVRVGLLATQGIRGHANRAVLRSILAKGHIFNAWSDREWVLDGAAVHVAIVAFTGTVPVGALHLNGCEVENITERLGDAIDLCDATPLMENANLQCMGDKKGASFEVSLDVAKALLGQPNSTNVANLDVLRPWANGKEINGRVRGNWIVDFGTTMTLDEAAQFEAPFEHIRQTVAPRYAASRKRWWLHERPRAELRAWLVALHRFLFTAEVSKHRIFVWMSRPALPDHTGFAFPRSDDYFFGVLHSSIHELWARHMGTQLREVESGFRYTPTTCFETFPLPWSPGKEPGKDPKHKAISAAAKDLDTQRERWLNPPEWLAPIEKRIDAADKFTDVPKEARPLIRHSAIMAAAAQDPKLKKRTLTNLYNERPTWLRLAHERLDRAVLNAYAAVDPKGKWQEDWAEVWTETGAGQPSAPNSPESAKRAEVEESVLANLLRLNTTRQK